MSRAADARPIAYEPTPSRDLIVRRDAAGLSILLPPSDAARVRRVRLLSTFALAVSTALILLAVVPVVAFWLLQVRVANFSAKGWTGFATLMTVGCGSGFLALWQRRRLAGSARLRPSVIVGTGWIEWQDTLAHIRGQRLRREKVERVEVISHPWIGVRGGLAFRTRGQSQFAFRGYDPAELDRVADAIRAELDRPVGGGDEAASADLSGATKPCASPTSSPA